VGLFIFFFAVCYFCAVVVISRAIFGMVFVISMFYVRFCATVFADIGTLVTFATQGVVMPYPAMTLNIIHRYFLIDQHLLP
jgi:hypothetical protein